MSGMTMAMMESSSKPVTSASRCRPLLSSSTGSVSRLCARPGNVIPMTETLPASERVCALSHCTAENPSLSVMTVMTLSGVYSVSAPLSVSTVLLRRFS